MPKYKVTRTMQYTETLEVEADNKLLARHVANENYDDWSHNCDDIAFSIEAVETL